MRACTSIGRDKGQSSVHASGRLGEEVPMVIECGYIRYCNVYSGTTADNLE